MSLGPAEIIGIVVLALLLFGSRKLPELGSSVGKTITNFKKGMSEAKEEEAAEAGNSQAGDSEVPRAGAAHSEAGDSKAATQAESADQA
ncbi:MAG: twin-arginine translocase TatA/TatE family subunit [Euzebya sp.]